MSVSIKHLIFCFLKPTSTITLTSTIVVDVFTAKDITTILLHMTTKQFEFALSSIPIDCFTVAMDQSEYEHFINF